MEVDWTSSVVVRDLETREPRLVETQARRRRGRAVSAVGRVPQLAGILFMVPVALKMDGFLYMEDHSYAARGDSERVF